MSQGKGARRVTLAALSAVFSLLIGVDGVEAQASHGGPQRIDARTVEVSAPPGLSADTTFSPDIVAELCGDGDGCVVRLASFEGDDPGRHAGGHYMTDPDGLRWIFEQGDTFVSGTLTDLLNVDILFLYDPSGGGAHCSFEEYARTGFPQPTLEYILKLDAGYSTGTSGCTLRIED